MVDTSPTIYLSQPVFSRLNRSKSPHNINHLAVSTRLKGALGVSP
jgi:hypothetical protein